MPDKPRVEADSSKDTSIDMAVTTPHVVASRVWVKPPNGKWSVVHDGEFRYREPDDFTLPPQPDGTLLHYWLGVGGNANEQFTVVVSFRQEGALPGGTHISRGTLDTHGKRFVDEEVEL